MDTTKKIAVMLGLCLMTSISFAGATFHPGDKGNQITTIQQALAIMAMIFPSMAITALRRRLQSANSRKHRDWKQMASSELRHTKP